ncbi:hypothetical protein MHC_02445 [Mycoplasma haemocanis str. Illinois]|uniref:Uncharacterized protein n=1 Tax=Mycoplasma haemocanis (strain Illinois) TaxID=1111676 RepID=H6N6T1_MYCHN|nr:hypothetical protein [Mycoplasma haemocanis]AEW45353.1 hypothetical protein MHC_02445 [Mycoplasma haemocanis str. Illinois]
MELTVFKTTGVLGGTVASATGAYGVYRLYFVNSGETIKSKLEAHFKGTNTTFLTPDHSEWSNLKTRYDRLSNKPKNKDGKTALNFDEVKTWCDTSVKERFKSVEDDLFKQVKEVCFLNVKTLLEELNKDGLKSLENANHTYWQGAWEAYKNDSDKESKGLKIKDSDKDSDLHGSAKEKGGPALHEWCTKTKDKKMYDADSLLPAFKAWCV